MAHFRFIGRHTGGRESITMCGATFVGDEPAEVSDADCIRRLRSNVEFEEVGENAGNLEDINTLRAAYKVKFDKRPFNGWDEATLREKLA